MSPPWVGFAVRPKPGIWEFVRINVEELIVEELSVSEYLIFKERLANGSEYVFFIFVCFFHSHNIQVISTEVVVHHVLLS